MREELTITVVECDVGHKMFFNADESIPTFCPVSCAGYACDANFSYKKSFVPKGSEKEYTAVRILSFWRSSQGSMDFLEELEEEYKLKKLGDEK